MEKDQQNDCNVQNTFVIKEKKKKHCKNAYIPPFWLKMDLHIIK